MFQKNSKSVQFRKCLLKIGEKTKILHAWEKLTWNSGPVRAALGVGIFAWNMNFEEGTAEKVGEKEETTIIKKYGEKISLLLDAWLGINNLSPKRSSLASYLICYGGDFVGRMSSLLYIQKPFIFLSSLWPKWNRDCWLLSQSIKKVVGSFFNVVVSLIILESILVSLQWLLKTPLKTSIICITSTLVEL